MVVTRVCTQVPKGNGQIMTKGYSDCETFRSLSVALISHLSLWELLIFARNHRPAMWHGIEPQNNQIELKTINMRPWQHGATLHKHICNTTTHAHKNHKHASKRKNRHTDGRFSQGWWVLFLIKMGGERKVWSFDVATHSPSVSLKETLKPFVFMQLMLIIKQTFCLC